MMFLARHPFFVCSQVRFFTRDVYVNGVTPRYVGPGQFLRISVKCLASIDEAEVTKSARACSYLLS